MPDPASAEHINAIANTVSTEQLATVWDANETAVACDAERLSKVVGLAPSFVVG
jgi:hypothetical protein